MLTKIEDVRKKCCISSVSTHPSCFHSVLTIRLLMDLEWFYNWIYKTKEAIRNPV